MLSSRQRQCLQGIGVRAWRQRGSADFDAVEPQAAAEPLSAAPPFDIIEPAAPAFESSRQPSPDTTIGIDAGAVTPVSAHAESSDGDRQAQPQGVASSIEIASLDNWEAIETAIQACTACELSQNCTHKVPGTGNRQADLLIVGEGPGHDEDLRGEPFVGRSGQLLDRMLAAIGFSRDQVYITNIVKCRPPSNRDPRPEEAQQCRAYLDAQIALLAPKVILSAGRVSAHNLLGSNLPVGKLIKQMHQLPGSDIPVKVTYHPAYLLRNPSAKAIAWQDMKLIYRMLQ